MSKHEDDKEISSHLENQAYDEPFSAAELAASGKHHDAALDILQTVAGGRREITAEENRQVLRKIDWHLMPVSGSCVVSIQHHLDLFMDVVQIMVIIYFAQFFDKREWRRSHGVGHAAYWLPISFRNALFRLGLRYSEGCQPPRERVFMAWFNCESRVSGIT